MGVDLRLPGFDLPTVQDVGLGGKADPEILEWAASMQRILVTHDLRTVPRYAGERVRAGMPMPGVIAVPTTLAVGKVIEDLVLLVECSREGEWENQIVYLPL